MSEITLCRKFARKAWICLSFPVFTSPHSRLRRAARAGASPVLGRPPLRACVTPPTVTNLSTGSSRPVSQGGVGMCGKARLDYSNCGWFIVSSFAIFRTWRFKFEQEIFAVVCACNCACVCVRERGRVCVWVWVWVCACVCVCMAHTHTHTRTHTWHWWGPHMSPEHTR